MFCKFKPAVCTSGCSCCCRMALTKYVCDICVQNYNLIVPNIRSFLLHIGASPTQAGIIIGCCDLASMPSTVGKLHKLSFRFTSFHVAYMICSQAHTAINHCNCASALFAVKRCQLGLLCQLRVCTQLASAGVATCDASFGTIAANTSEAQYSIHAA